MPAGPPPGSPPPATDPFPDLPVDPDLLEPRPVHTQPALIGLVLLGGLIGAPLRYAISRAWPTPARGIPWSTFTTNVGGAALLGALLEVLARSGPDTGRRRAVRLLVGTGLLGAFTTYSTFAVETDLLVRDHADARAAVYVVLSVTAGLLASLVGVAVAAGVHRRVHRADR